MNVETIFSEKAWATVWRYRVTFLNGLLNTLESAVVGLGIALIIGFTLGLMATSGKRALRIIARIYVEFFQNTPLILQVCFLYYALAYSGVKISVVVVGFIALGFYHGGVCRGGCAGGHTGCALRTVRRGVGAGIWLHGDDEAHHFAADHQNHSTADGQSGGGAHQEHIVPVYHRRSRSDCDNL